ncbi:hypothetical protein [Aneurinibacillus tyrosinisolvens]|jgi:hypothetical protein|uniref:hypothetical protein n=1 Tax=Aneurinibacillus tyrosinisolvens TaxID=1443435 RepID=UPI00063FAFDE|nr:hypothetical protein [Aneurinibacillus tyrosinisolvens]
MECFNVGDWVQFPYKENGKVIHLNGYVKDINEGNMMITVFVPVTNEPLKQSLVRGGHFRVPLDLAEQISNLELYKEDYNALIDIALDTKDIRWFHELVTKRDK